MYTHTQAHAHTTIHPPFSLAICSLFPSWVPLILPPLLFPKVIFFLLHLLGVSLNTIPQDISICLWLPMLFLKNQHFSWATDHTSHTSHCLLNFSNWTKGTSPQHFQERTHYLLRKTCSSFCIHPHSWWLSGVSPSPLNLLSILSLVNSTSSIPLRFDHSSPRSPLYFQHSRNWSFLKFLLSLTSSSTSLPGNLSQYSDHLPCLNKKQKISWENKKSPGMEFSDTSKSINELEGKSL